MSKVRVAILIALIFFAILGFDAYLYADGVEGNSFSQVIIWLTDMSPLVPYGVGFLCGFLCCHWFESYFMRGRNAV